MKCLIIDDDPSSILVIKLLCDQVKEITVVAEFDNSINAYSFLQKQQVDFLFLDIQMKGMNGVELIKSLGSNAPLIIFISSSNEYASEAYDLNVVDYMLKPVLLPRFLQSIKKMTNALQCKKAPFSIAGDECIFIKDKTALQRINIDDILFCQAAGDYVKVHSQDKSYMVNTTLGFLDTSFPNKIFLRVHRSYLAATNKINRVDDGYVYIKDQKIPVSNSYRTELLNYLKPL